jgi:hypothetical protein
MMKITEIDLMKYTIEELFELNNRIVSRIKEMRKNQVEEQIKKFKLGDIVSCEIDGKKVFSLVTNILKQKISLLTENNQQYTVNPLALTLEEDKDKKIERKIIDIINKEIDKAMKGEKIIK